MRVAVPVQGSHVAVRNTAGESLALLFNQCGLQQLPDNDDELLPDSDSNSRDGDCTSIAATSSPSLDCSSCGVSPLMKDALVTGFDGILVQMEALSKNRFVFALNCLVLKYLFAMSKRTYTCTTSTILKHLAAPCLLSQCAWEWQSVIVSFFSGVSASKATVGNPHHCSSLPTKMM